MSFTIIQSSNNETLTRSFNDQRKLDSEVKLCSDAIIKLQVQRKKYKQLKSNRLSPIEAKGTRRYKPLADV